MEDIIAARMGMEPKYSSSSSDDFAPDPCNTPRPSTPYGAREREFLRATMDWAGMYDRLEDQEEAIAKARSDRSTSTTPSSSLFSSSTVKNGETSRATSLCSGRPEEGKKDQVIWKTAYEDAVSKEELGRQLDERAAKAKGTACDETDSESDEDEYGNGESLFKTGPQSDAEDEEEPEIPRNSVFRAWNDVDSDDEDHQDDDGEGDSDDDISECDIEPDPSSLSTSSRPRGDESAAIEKSIETLQVNHAMGTERDMEKKKEKDKQQEKEKMVPAPYVRPNARSFLQMFYRPPVPPVPIESDDQSKNEKEDQIPPATDLTSSLDHDEKEAATEWPTDTSSRPRYSAENKDSNLALAKDMLRTADIGDDDHESSTIDSFDRHESDEENDDYDEAEKMTPNTSFDSHSDIETDKKGPQTMLHPPSQRKGDIESSARSAYTESTALFDAGSDPDEDDEDEEDGEEDCEDGGTIEHNDKHNASNDLVEGGGVDADHVDRDPSDTVCQNRRIDDDNNEDIENIQNPRTHVRDHNENNVNSKAFTQINNDNDPQSWYDPYAGMSYEEILADPRDFGLYWDIHIPSAYKKANPNPNYHAGPIIPSLDWWTEEIDDEWTVAVDWYQGGFDPEPQDIEEGCPLFHWGRHYRVIKYIEPTQVRPWTQAEADATFFMAGHGGYEQHARWLEEKLVAIERWRKVEIRMNLMVNWRVRTGQQPTLCDGWWFMNKGQRWWARELNPGRRPCNPYYG